MGFDTELTGILRDVVQFLECLREVKLPTSLECIRNNLLIRSKDTLTMFMVERLGGTNSPEPYLNMNASRPKGLVATVKTENELQEYVGAEESRLQKQQQQQQHQDYYETLQTIDSTTVPVNGTDSIREKEEEIENTLLDAYANLSAAQARSKCQMCGSLYRKEGKKLFVFEQYRACWVGLIGLHLLVYGSDRDNRPCTILPIRGYMARAAPNAVPRDQRRSESTFEIFRPGSRTFQFVARTPKDMEQWIVKICECGSADKTDHKTVSKVAINASVENNATHPDEQENLECREERYQDVRSLVTDNNSEQPLIISNEETTDSSYSKNTFLEANTSSPPTSAIVPAVPSVLSPPPPPPPPPPPSPPVHSSSARTPRKLPSLPVHRSSYEFLDEEEDDIYHKIEDYRDAIHYGNVGEIDGSNARSKREPVTYDDVCASIKANASKSERKQRMKNCENVARKSLNLRNETTYDDTANTLSKDGKNIIIDEQDKFLSYDDVENFARSIKARATDKTEESVKSPQKKSFLGRVRSKKGSPKKNEKKEKCKTVISPPPCLPPVTSNQEPQTYYDDVSDLTKTREIKRVEDDSEYTCPPAPRPIYVKPPTIDTVIDTQQFYDDVSAYREKSDEDRDRGRDHDACKFDQRTPKKQNYSHDRRTSVNIDHSLLRENIEDNEHYKTPRVDAGHPKSIFIEHRDELYDDIAILADFTARQKEYLGKKDNEETSKLQASPEKKSWNRFVSSRKSKMADSSISEMDNRSSNGIDDSTDDLNEQQGSMRMNTFQKLISRMENSLGKASVRTASSILLNKTNVANNA